MEGKAKVIRYSRAFREKVVREIEEGKLNVNQAQKLYDIKGGETIQRWIRLLGKNELLNKVVRIELTDEVNKLKELEKEKQQFESALAKAHLKIMSLEKIIQIASEEYGEDIKKKYDTEA